MDRQKNIPPLSTKITRKLAQESADHNSLMNFYSSISRDETGAPKKWKMSSPLMIDEDSITSKKAGSNKSTPTGSRENSNERRRHQSASSSKSSRGGRRQSHSRDGSSSEQNSSRESSLDNRDNTKDTPIVKKKRGRPKSLDLKDKLKLKEVNMANGDSDNFKSPDPLTPCNITVKRKKGRPKETPPVLVAEAPVEALNTEKEEEKEEEKDEEMIYSEPEEQSIEPVEVKRKPGRPRKKIKSMLNTDKLKSLSKGDKMKSFGMKRFDGKSLKTYGSKIIKKKVQRGFRKFTKISNHDLDKTEVIDDDNEVLSKEGEDGKIDEKLENAQLSEGEDMTVKKRPGRPPKNKKKSFFNTLTIMKAKSKGGRPPGSKNKPKFNPVLLQRPLNRGPGRPPGAKNKEKSVERKTEVTDNGTETELVSVKPSPNENSVEIKKEEVVDSTADKSTVVQSAVADDLDNEIQLQSPVTLNEKPKPVMNDTFNAVDEAIEAVVCKARSDEPFEVKNRPRGHFKSAMFYKRQPTNLSLAKSKKQKDLVEKIRKKQILKIHETNNELIFDNSNLASNDLRRKLHSKLIEKMSLLNKTGKMNESGAKPDEIENSESVSEIDKELFQSGDSSSNPDNNQLVVETQNMGVNEDKTVAVNVEIADKTSKLPRRGRKSSLTKFSDTESICSELSSTSFASVKRPVDKQILILGEDNMDSDDSTVRTRQRFEIIPGKKRKRTLSGEFDLLDEKQLRKQKKRDEKDQSDEESETVRKETADGFIEKPKFKKKSPIANSKHFKIKDGKVSKKSTSQYIAYKNRLLKQSPFLNKNRKKKRKVLIKRKHEEKTLPLVNAQNEESSKDTDNSSSTVETLVTKPDTYRTGLFEKFSNDSNESLLLSEDLKESSNKVDDAKSDDTESTIELKDMLSEDQDEMPVEESVDDSDVFNFHAEDDSESAGKELYTDSEIDVREMLFDIIDSVVNNCEVKTTPIIKDSCEKSILKIGSPSKEEANINLTLGDNIQSKTVKPVQPDDISENNVDKTENTNKNILSESIKNDENKEMVIEMVARKKPGRKPKNVPQSSAVTISQANIQKVINADGTERIRKKPGRKPKPKVNKDAKEQTLYEEDKSPVPKAALNTEVSSSPEMGATRKFELRQKISRSPLDNIALKQSLEENEYLKSEAQRVSRKEAKWKSKLKATNQESVESLVTPVNEEELVENELQDTDSYESDEEEIQEKVTIEDLIKDCKPCKVILKDFIKELERTQGESDSSESEMLCEDSQGSSDVDRFKSPVKLKDSNEVDLSRRSDLDAKINAEASIKINQKNENVFCRKTDENLKSEIGNTYHKKELLKQDNNEAVCDKKDDINKDTVDIHCHDFNSLDQKDNKVGNQGEKKDSVDQFKDENKDSVNDVKLKQQEKELDLPENANDLKLNNGLSSDFKDIQNNELKTNIIESSNDLKQTKKNLSPLKREAKLKEPKPKRKSPIKSKVAEEIKDKPQKPISPYKKQKVHTSYEQQTARKTVPPLKIKVKDAYSSRRKTYMVEPSPDSPVESSDMLSKSESKHEKKSKFKSGNKSESSDSEKHKGHHHKRKNKSPSVEINTQSKLSLNDAPKNSNKLASDKPLIKATDAYEANFLQFIQDKDKVEQNIAAFSSSLGQKNKLHSLKNKDGKLSVKHKNNTKFLNQEALTVTQDEKSNDSDSNDVQYVCSQCDDIVYRAKDDIVRHYAEVHPGHQFIYKPLPDTSSENSNSQTDVNSNEKKENESPAPDGMLEPLHIKTSIEENQVGEDDDDAGSLNLKIVEVVSLKDQNNIHDSEMLEISKSENERLHISGAESQISASQIQVSVPQLVTSQILQQPVLRTNDDLMNQIHLNQIHAQLSANQMQANNLQLRLASNQNQANTVQTELKIPNFSVLNTTMSPSYSFIASKPPPPYYAQTMSIQTPLSIPGLVQTNAPVSFMSNLINQMQLTSQPKVRPPLNAAKLKSPSQPGKLGNTFKCEKCNVHAPMLAAMVAHLRNVHKEIPRLFQCPYCKDMEAENEAQIHQHIKKNHPSNNPNPPVALSEPAKRNLKTLNIKLPDNLKLGEGNNIEKDIYMCLKCKEHRPSLETIYEHLEQHHADVFAYVCPMCKVFKSPLEDLVNKHISNDHGQNPSNVSLSLAIDGNHFSRVQCLIKDKQKSSQKSAVSPLSSKQTSPVLPQHNGRAALSVPGQQNSETQHLIDTPHSTEQSVLKPSLNAIGSFAALQQQSKTPSPSVTPKPTQQQNQKKKKTLLESIEKLTVQKLEEQGLLGSKSESSSPSHPSQLQGLANTTPPPLMRGPPPLIRYDQLNKMPSSHTALLTSTLKTSSQFAALNPATSLALKSPSNLQRLQNMTNTTTLPTQLNTTARPIQSALFDTSDLDQVKSTQNQRPVLNVPVVPRMANQPSHLQNLPIKSKEGPTTTGAPLDLSKTPSPSPIPQNVVSPNVPQMMGGGGINPEIFKVFNIRPSPQMQIPRPQGQMSQQMVGQPIMTPQQVRQNTPSTLAYRPPGPQMIATSQMPQFISMPVGTVILSNITPQGIPTFPLGTTIPGLQTAQFVRMTTPQVSASGAGTAMIITSSQSAPTTALTSIPKAVAAQPFPKNMLFKCPYCPKVVPLRLDQVKPHIENQHPGSAILFQQFETK